MPLVYRSSKWHYRERKFICGVMKHFIADTDADETCFGIHFADADTAVLCSLEEAAHRR